MAAMSGYTIANLKEVEDQAPKFGLSPDLEARFARVALDAEMIGITYQRLAPNVRIPWGHTHKTIELHGVREPGDEIHELGPWDVIRVHKDTMRGMEAGPEGAEFVAIGAPGGPGDAVTVQDWWPHD